MDECQDPNSCIDGQCVNTEGSYNCFCTHPMVLDASEKRCIRPTESHGTLGCKRQVSVQINGKVFLLTEMWATGKEKNGLFGYFGVIKMRC